MLEDIKSLQKRLRELDKDTNRLSCELDLNNIRVHHIFYTQNKQAQQNKPFGYAQVFITL